MNILRPFHPQNVSSSDYFKPLSPHPPLSPPQNGAYFGREMEAQNRLCKRYECDGGPGANIEWLDIYGTFRIKLAYLPMKKINNFSSEELS